MKGGGGAGGGLKDHHPVALRDIWLEDIYVSVLLAFTCLVQISVVDLLYNQDGTLQFISHKEWESFVKD